MLSSSTLLFSRPGGAAALLRPSASLLCRRPLHRCTEEYCRVRTRRNQFASSIVAAAAAAADGNHKETKQQQKRDPKLLRALLAEAVSEEDYKEASRLKSELERDPSILLQLQLEEAVKEEKYADAAKLKARLDALLPPPPPKFEPGPTTSDTVTDGIRVKVKSFFVASQSVAGSTFTFAYRSVFAKFQLMKERGLKKGFRERETKRESRAHHLFTQNQNAHKKKSGSKSATRPGTRPSSCSPAPGRSSTAATAPSATPRGPKGSAGPASSARRLCWGPGSLFRTRASHSCGRPQGRCEGLIPLWRWRRRRMKKGKRRRKWRERKEARRRRLLLRDNGSSSRSSAGRLGIRERGRSAPSLTS